ncbi:hypothetical protein BDV06DRAFT_228384 [Aspergillus oleicola]
MTAQRVVPPDRQVAGIQNAEGHTANLIRQAQESDEADRKLTIRQAVSKYKKAVFWAIFLSISLIMEGYDLVIITSFYNLPLHGECRRRVFVYRKRI